MTLRLIVSSGRLVLTIDEKWEHAKAYYERFYKDPKTKVPVRFHQRPSDVQVEELYKKMQLVKSEISNYLAFKPGAASKV